jgi:(p)ppGpp synthase/HD superfamily hydrolase
MGIKTEKISIEDLLNKFKKYNNNEKDIELIQKAYDYAEKKHFGQKRITGDDYITHPLNVAWILTGVNADAIAISAALLHDTIEECKEVDEALICSEFGSRVAKLVAQESEDKSKTWMERKSHTIERLKIAPIEIQMIALADKLSNMRDIDRDYPECGEELWNRFRMKDKNVIGWYYKSIRDVLADSLHAEKAYQEYCDLVEKNFQ